MKRVELHYSTLQMAAQPLCKNFNGACCNRDHPSSHRGTVEADTRVRVESKAPANLKVRLVLRIAYISAAHYRDILVCSMAAPQLLGLPPMSSDLKSILPYLQRADELKQKDPVMAYWCTSLTQP